MEIDTQQFCVLLIRLKLKCTKEALQILDSTNSSQSFIYLKEIFQPVLAIFTPHSFFVLCTSFVCQLKTYECLS